MHIEDHLPSGVPEDVRPILGDFRAIVHLQRQVLMRTFARYDLHPGQAMCLAVLAEAGEIGQSDLADRLVLSRPAVTRVLQRLEKAGLVVRRSCHDDQRTTLVALSDAGRDLQHHLHEALGEYAATTLSRLSEEDREALRRILPRWRAVAEEAVS